MSVNENCVVAWYRLECQNPFCPLPTMGVKTIRVPSSRLEGKTRKEIEALAREAAPEGYVFNELRGALPED